MNEPTVRECIIHDLIRCMADEELHAKMTQMEFREEFDCYEGDTWRLAYEETYRLCKEELERREELKERRKNEVPYDEELHGDLPF